jgi:hypothetical protein
VVIEVAVDSEAETAEIEEDDQVFKRKVGEITIEEIDQ